MNGHFELALRGRISYHLEVGEVVAQALTTEKPEAHYLIGPGARK